MTGRVRHWWHLQLRVHRATGLICLALPSRAARLLSSSVAGGAEPSRAWWTPQPLDYIPLRENPSGWHRFCPLLAWKPHGGSGDGPAVPVRYPQVGREPWGKRCSGVSPCSAVTPPCDYRQGQALRSDCWREVFEIIEETWYVRKCRDWSIL
jgi:hypothetical protein